ncbi:MAG: hypothetical protein ABIT05_03230 [Chitinophagaceae bacterium]
MKKIIGALLVCGTLLLAGCYESTQEITLNADGTGTISNTNDLSALIAVAKQMGAGAELEKAPQQTTDSTVSMEKGADSIPNLTPQEREMARKGTLRINMNLKEEKFKTNLTFPFSSPSEIPVYNKLSDKIMAGIMKGKADDMSGGGAGSAADQMPELSSFDDYYTYEFSNGELKRKLNKEKFAGVESDQYLKAMKEAAGMGLNMKATYIINLPRPAKEAEGKGVKLSEDKKKVTITAGIDDFFDDPSLLEFKIKY